ncbi:hypothetical protein IFM89_018954 [Coptis chinensis]|uniref:F-box domain-containing protein n=1 Tax=Coptis chinensis TaxID=261450 RepID=A0A835M0L6_9MAGN|nr:hypothetical protein IFM89_018954 [Coptis chinensis]
MATFKRLSRVGVAWLPDEIISNILLRVPTTDIIRFKSVSKSWLSLISNPIFAEEVLGRSNQHPEDEQGEEIILKTINKDRKYEYYYSSINTQTDKRPKKLFFASKDGANLNDLSLIYSCNYLLLFRNKYHPNQLYIYNFITALFVALPPAKYDGVRWALAYDPRIRKYKVYGICTRRKFLTLTQGESDWKEVNIHTRSSRLKSLTELLLVNEELHWLALDFYDHELVYYIVAINVETSELRSTILPPYYAEPPPLEREGHYLLTAGIKWELLSLTIVTNDEIKIFVLQGMDNNYRWNNVQWFGAGTIDLKYYLLGKKPEIFLNNFLSTDVCVIAARDDDGEDFPNNVKLVVHHEDQLFFSDTENKEWKPILFLSKDQKLCRQYLFRINSYGTPLRRPPAEPFDV